MPLSEKDRLAAEITRLRSDFEAALFGNKRRCPLQEFMAFWEAGRRYAKLTRSDPLIHRSGGVAVHGLEDIVGQGRKRIIEDTPLTGVWMPAPTDPSSRNHHPDSA